MLVIRLFRTGKKNQPSFKIVVTDKRKSAKKGRSVEEVGFWDPIKKVKTLKGDRIKYWLSVGAKASDTVHNFLVQEKIIEGKKIAVNKKVAKEAVEAVPAEEAKKENVTVQEKPAEEPKKEDVSSEAATKVEAKEEKPEEKSADLPSETSVKEGELKTKEAK